MKKMKSVVALLMAAALILGMAGCGKQGGGQESEPAGKETGNVTEDAGTGQESEDAGSGQEAHYSSQALPIVPEGEEKTLKVWIRMGAQTADPEEVWFYHFVKDVMNINLEVTPFANENADEFLSLGLSDGDLPDLIIGGNFTAQELVNYGAGEGMLLDLAPYINETYMPNLAAIYEANPGYKEAVTDTEGHVWSLGSIMDVSNIEQIDRMFMNYVYVEEVGKEIPTTLDEFLDVMRAIKAAHPDFYPVGGSSAVCNPTEFLLNAFGYLNADVGTMICLRNGEVVYPVADREAYGEFLKFMHTLYEEELIHPEFYTMTSDETLAMGIENKTALWKSAPFAQTDRFPDWWGVIPLTSDYNDTPQWPAADSAISCGGVVVSADTEEIDLICAFLDWFYTWDGYRTSTTGPNSDLHPDWLLDNWGGWKVVNGSVVHSDVENNPDKWASSAEYVGNAIELWTYFTVGLAEDDGSYGDVAPSIYNFVKNIDYSRDADDLRQDPEIISNGNIHFQAAMQDCQGQYITSDIFPSKVYLSVEETEHANELKTALDQYAKTESAKFVTGQRSLDELDAYFDEMERLGAEEYVQIYKDYYESVK